MLALLQAEEDNRRQVVFGKTCRTCEWIMYWDTDNGICSLATPPGRAPAQLRETIVAMAGLESFGGFPKQSELVMQFGKTRMSWQVSFTGPEDEITLRRLA